MRIPATAHDAELVAESLLGRRDAFAEIVDRYKSLICSLAYSATGSLSQSEDLAQDTFLTAWKLLPALREPAKLRPWLCSIARHLIGKTLRRDGREPVHKAAPLETEDEFSSGEALPPEQTISREEETILWRSIERIPETYRECLVLFYREGESVGRIATELEISEDAVKQRLSRGRKLLTEEITAFVEGALRRSAPGKAFTFGVLAALPMVPSPAKAAAIGTAAVKGGSTVVKAAVGSGVFNAILGPALALFGTYFGYKLDRDTARSPGGQQFVRRYYSYVVIGMAAFAVAVLILVLAGSSLLESRAKLYAGLWIGLGAASLVVVAAGIAWVCARRRTFREQAADFQLVPLFEYRSNLTLLGWPLVHIRIRGGLERGPVKAWIAAGDSAIGILFALGAVAIAPISLGGLSMGLVTVGGLAVGLLSLGGFSFGAWAIGAFAIGWQSYGACAIAWSAAQGAVACAGDFASGAAAIGRHANDSAAQAFFDNSRFYQNVQVAMRFAPWLNLLCLLPLLLWWRQKRMVRHQTNT